MRKPAIAEDSLHSRQSIRQPHACEPSALAYKQLYPISNFVLPVYSLSGQKKKGDCTMADALGPSAAVMRMAGVLMRRSQMVMVPSLAPDMSALGVGLPVSSGPTQVTVP